MQICQNSELGNPGWTCSDLTYKIGKDLTFQGHSFSTLEYDIENNSFDDFNIGLKQSFSNVSAESRGDFFVMGIAGPHSQSFCSSRSGWGPRIYVSHTCPGDAAAADPRTQLCFMVCCTFFNLKKREHF